MSANSRSDGRDQGGANRDQGGVSRCVSDVDRLIVLTDRLMSSDGGVATIPSDAADQSHSHQDGREQVHNRGQGGVVVLHGAGGRERVSVAPAAVGASVAPNVPPTNRVLLPSFIFTHHQPRHVPLPRRSTYGLPLSRVRVALIRTPLDDPRRRRLYSTPGGDDVYLFGPEGLAEEGTAMYTRQLHSNAREIERGLRRDEPSDAWLDALNVNEMVQYGRPLSSLERARAPSSRHLPRAAEMRPAPGTSNWARRSLYTMIYGRVSDDPIIPNDEVMNGGCDDRKDRNDDQNDEDDSHDGASGSSHRRDGSNSDQRGSVQQSARHTEMASDDREYYTPATSLRLCIRDCKSFTRLLYSYIKNGSEGRMLAVGIVDVTKHSLQEITIALCNFASALIDDRNSTASCVSITDGWDYGKISPSVIAKLVQPAIPSPTPVVVMTVLDGEAMSDDDTNLPASSVPSPPPIPVVAVEDSTALIDTISSTVSVVPSVPSTSVVLASPSSVAMVHITATVTGVATAGNSPVIGRVELNEASQPVTTVSIASPTMNMNVTRIQHSSLPTARQVSGVSSIIPPAGKLSVEIAKYLKCVLFNKIDGFFTIADRASYRRYLAIPATLDFALTYVHRHLVDGFGMDDAFGLLLLLLHSTDGVVPLDGTTAVVKSSTAVPAIHCPSSVHHQYGSASASVVTTSALASSQGSASVTSASHSSASHHRRSPQGTTVIPARTESLAATMGITDNDIYVKWDRETRGLIGNEQLYYDCTKINNSTILLLVRAELARQFELGAAVAAAIEQLIIRPSREWIAASTAMMTAHLNASPSTMLSSPSSMVTGRRTLVTPSPSSMTNPAAAVPPSSSVSVARPLTAPPSSSLVLTVESPRPEVLQFFNSVLERLSIPKRLTYDERPIPLTERAIVDLVRAALLRYPSPIAAVNSVIDRFLIDPQYGLAAVAAASSSSSVNNLSRQSVTVTPSSSFMNPTQPSTIAVPPPSVHWIQRRAAAPSSSSSSASMSLTRPLLDAPSSSSSSSMSLTRPSAAAPSSSSSSSMSLTRPSAAAPSSSSSSSMSLTRPSAAAPSSSSSSSMSLTRPSAAAPSSSSSSSMMSLDQQFEPPFLLERAMSVLESLAGSIRDSCRPDLYDAMRQAMTNCPILLARVIAEMKDLSAAEFADPDRFYPLTARCLIAELTSRPSLKIEWAVILDGMQEELLKSYEATDPPQPSVLPQLRRDTARQLVLPTLAPDIINNRRLLLFAHDLFNVIDCIGDEDWSNVIVAHYRTPANMERLIKQLNDGASEGRRMRERLNIIQSGIQRHVLDPILVRTDQALPTIQILLRHCFGSGDSSLSESSSSSVVDPQVRIREGGMLMLVSRRDGGESHYAPTTYRSTTPAELVRVGIDAVLDGDGNSILNATVDICCVEPPSCCYRLYIRSSVYCDSQGILTPHGVEVFCGSEDGSKDPILDPDGRLYPTDVSTRLVNHQLYQFPHCDGKDNYLIYSLNLRPMVLPNQFIYEFESGGRFILRRMLNQLSLHIDRGANSIVSFPAEIQTILTLSPHDFALLRADVRRAIAVNCLSLVGAPGVRYDVDSLIVQLPQLSHFGNGGEHIITVYDLIRIYQVDFAYGGLGYNDGDLPNVLMDEEWNSLGRHSAQLTYSHTMRIGMALAGFVVTTLYDTDATLAIFSACALSHLSATGLGLTTGCFSGRAVRHGICAVLNGIFSRTIVARRGDPRDAACQFIDRQRAVIASPVPPPRPRVSCAAAAPAPLTRTGPVTIAPTSHRSVGRSSHKRAGGELIRSSEDGALNGEDDDSDCAAASGSHGHSGNSSSSAVAMEISEVAPIAAASAVAPPPSLTIDAEQAKRASVREKWSNKIESVRSRSLSLDTVCAEAGAAIAVSHYHQSDRLRKILPVNYGRDRSSARGVSSYHKRVDNTRDYRETHLIALARQKMGQWVVMGAVRNGVVCLNVDSPLPVVTLSEFNDHLLSLNGGAADVSAHDKRPDGCDYGIIEACDPTTFDGFDPVIRSELQRIMQTNTVNREDHEKKQASKPAKNKKLAQSVRLTAGGSSPLPIVPSSNNSPTASGSSVSLADINSMSGASSPASSISSVGVPAAVGDVRHTDASSSSGGLSMHDPSRAPDHPMRVAMEDKGGESDDGGQGKITLPLGRYYQMRSDCRSSQALRDEVDTLELSHEGLLREHDQMVTDHLATVAQHAAAVSTINDELLAVQAQNAANTAMYQDMLTVAMQTISTVTAPFNIADHIDIAIGQAGMGVGNAAAAGIGEANVDAAMEDPPAVSNLPNNQDESKTGGDEMEE